MSDIVALNKVEVAKRVTTETIPIKTPQLSTSINTNPRSAAINKFTSMAKVTDQDEIRSLIGICDAIMELIKIVKDSKKEEEQEAISKNEDKADKTCMKLKFLEVATCLKSKFGGTKIKAFFSLYNKYI